MDQETRAFLEERFGKIDGLREEMSQGLGGLREEMSQGLGGLREEMSQKIDGLREDMREGDRLTRVVVEGLRGDVKLVAEGLMGMSDRMARHEAEVGKKLEELTTLFIPCYQGLDRRLKVLEEWADGQNRDVIERIREKFGRRQSL